MKTNQQDAFEIISKDEIEKEAQNIEKPEEQDGWFTQKAVTAAQWIGWGAGIYFGQCIIPGLAAQATRAAAVAAMDAGIKATPLIGGVIGYATRNSSVINSIYNSTVLTPLSERAGYQAYACTLNPGEKALAFLGSNTLLSGGIFGAVGSKICETTTRYTIKTTGYVASKTYESAKKTISGFWTNKAKENIGTNTVLAA